MTKTINLHNVYLALGSNIGDKKKNIDNAIENIKLQIGSVVAISSLYETEPFGFSSENLFFNAVCLVQTEFSVMEVLEKCQNIEKELGRETKSINQIYADRSIDIDILLYDDKILDTNQLTIPHPHMHEREFVLDPLSEIAPAVIHPRLKKSISVLRKDLDKNSLKK